MIRAYELIDVQLPPPPASLVLSPYPSLCLVTEYFPGRPLSFFYSLPRYASGFPLLEFFPVALSLLSTVSSIHSAHIVHKDITHNNVLYDVDTRSTRIIDFGLSELRLVGGAETEAGKKRWVLPRYLAIRQPGADRPSQPRSGLPE